MNFEQFTVVLLIRANSAPQLDEETASALQDAHLHHLATMHESGLMKAAGPFMVEDDEPLRGICIFNVDAATTQDLCERDPAVIAGTLTAKVLPWMVPAGAIAFSQTRFPHSRAEVGD